MIIHNVKEGEYNEDVELFKRITEIKRIKDRLERSKKIVEFITEDYDSWNFLKENMKNEDEHLRITEAAIENNPKSYQAWYHRLFTFKKYPELLTKNIEREIGLINVLLKFDDRNFHCWNYKEALISMLEDELSNTIDIPTNKNYTKGNRLNNLIYKLKGLSKNVSNYSFLHFNKNVLDPISCIYTDPFDQSCWFYYFRIKEDYRLNKGFYLRVYKNEIEVRFKEVFCGNLSFIIDDKTFNFFVDVPTRIFYFPYSDSFVNIEMNINNSKYSLNKVHSKNNKKKVGASNSIVFEEIIELEPLSYLNYIFNWENVTDNGIIEYLKKIDPLRSNLYQFLKNENFQLYLIKN